MISNKTQTIDWLLRGTTFVTLGVLGVALLCTPQLAAQTSQPAETTAAEQPAAGAHPALLDPKLANEQAPDVYRVKVETTKGDFVIEVTRVWSPRGADRFYNLVKIGYYTDIAFYRVISGFMAQGGFHGDPEVTAAWMNARIEDDTIIKDNRRGTVTFAMGGPNTRTTQIFINFVDNSYLKQHGKFTPFGRVVEGMEVVDSLYAGYGEGAPRGRGPSQRRVGQEGNDYLRAEFPKLDYIKRMDLLD